MQTPIFRGELAVSFREGTHFLATSLFFFSFSPKKRNPKKNKSFRRLEPSPPQTNSVPSCLCTSNQATCTGLDPIQEIQRPAHGLFLARSDGPEVSRPGNQKKRRFRFESCDTYNSKCWVVTLPVIVEMKVYRDSLLNWFIILVVTGILGGGHNPK